MQEVWASNWSDQEQRANGWRKSQGLTHDVTEQNLGLWRETTNNLFPNVGERPLERWGRRSRVPSTATWEGYRWAAGDGLVH